MKKAIITTFIFLLYFQFMSAQPAMEIEGSIKIGNNTDPNPGLGTMRWSGSDFELWNGVIWASLTGNKEVGTVTDIDGNIYKTIRIGSQVWMTENLRTTRYRNGDIIPNITSNTDWENLTIGARCIYDTTGNGYLNFDIEKFGYLYNSFTVTDSRKLCPSGWHEPSVAEWTTLTDYLGGSDIAGGKMKSKGTIEAETGYWSHPNTGATNESGFSGLPGGFRSPTGSFFDIGLFGNWWSSAESPANAWYHPLNNVNEIVFSFDFINQAEII